jgi:hypothetical protein
MKNFRTTNSIFSQIKLKGGGGGGAASFATKDFFLHILPYICFEGKLLPLNAN